LERLDKKDRAITISTEIDQEKAVLTIRDNGSGLPENITEKLFEPFVTAGENGSMGLGLFIVKNIVRQIGGTIEYNYQDGAVFTIMLPIAIEVKP